MMTVCLIKQDACGRVEGNPVCPKCGIDNRVVYPGQGDLEVALTAAKAKYWEAHARQLEAEAEASKNTKVNAPDSRVEEKVPIPDTAAGAPTKKKPYLEWIGMGLAVVLALGVGTWFKTERIREKERTEEMNRALSQISATEVLSVRNGQRGSGENSENQKSSKNVRQATELEMVAIPSGSFTMGSNEEDDEKPPHRVSIRSFELGKYEVTQGQWKAVMGNNPSGFSSCGDNCPVDRVSWNDIQQFIQKLNQKTGKTYRLPNESEWEYAARAGTSVFTSARRRRKKKSVFALRWRRKSAHANWRRNKCR